MKPIVRTITGFISVKDFSGIDELMKDISEVKASLINAGYEIQTIRITTDILDEISNFDRLSQYSDFLEKLEKEEEVSIYHIGSISSEEKLNSETEEKLVDFFLNHPKAFMAVNAGDSKESKELCLQGARICKFIADKSPFECRRFAVFAGVKQSTPFYPASRVFDNSLKISIGLQCANLAVEEATNSNKDLLVFENKLKTRMEEEFGAVGKLFPEDIKDKFIGFDTSLAPFPQDEHSIANAIEIILGKPFGSSGTLAVCRLLTRVMKENNIKKTGLCGLMLPVVEDNILAKRGIEGNYTWKELLLFSSVCATGLDTIPISGQTATEDLADAYFDLATLAIKLDKPLSARFFIEPDKLPGDTIKYDWKFAAESPIFKI